MKKSILLYFIIISARKKHPAVISHPGSEETAQHREANGVRGWDDKSPWAESATHIRLDPGKYSPGHRSRSLAREEKSARSFRLAWSVGWSKRAPRGVCDGLLANSERRALTNASLSYCWDQNATAAPNEVPSAVTLRTLIRVRDNSPRCPRTLNACAIYLTKIAPSSEHDKIIPLQYLKNKPRGIFELSSSHDHFCHSDNYLSLMVNAFCVQKKEIYASRRQDLTDKWRQPLSHNTKVSATSRRSWRLKRMLANRCDAVQ